MDGVESCCGSIVAYAEVYAAVLFAVEKGVEYGEFVGESKFKWGERSYAEEYAHESGVDVVEGAGLANGLIVLFRALNVDPRAELGDPEKKSVRSVISLTFSWPKFSEHFNLNYFWH